MASSYANQIPLIVYVIQQIAPKSVLDIGKGFGKYGFLTHEFAGIDPQKRPDPTQTLAQQSGISIDAVDINPDYTWPHLSHFYRQVIIGDITKIYKELPAYDLIVMTDVIEHLEKKAALQVVQHFLDKGAMLLISTPVEYFQQDLYESEAEHHVSHWTVKDLQLPGRFVDRQNVYPGRVFLISPRPFSIRGFGHGPVKSLRRLARSFLTELNNTFGSD